MSNNRVYQKAIADQLNISPSTVAKVLSHDPVYRISPETRRLILDTAQSMGIRTRRKSTKNIAFVQCGRSTLDEHLMHMAFCEEASKYAYRTFLIHKSAMPTYEEIVSAVNLSSVDGIVLEGEISAEVANSLAEIMPTIILGHNPECIEIDHITSDDELLGRQLTEMLINMGHKHIAVIAFTLDCKMWRYAVNGYRTALEKAGIEFDNNLICEPRYKLYVDVIKELMSHDPKPTALLAWIASDHHGAIISTLRAMEYEIPRDLSYVGWAAVDAPMEAGLPVITCLDGQIESHARVGVRRLMDRIADNSLPPETILVPVNILRGQTCVNIYET